MMAENRNNQVRAAAFYDVDGTLVDSNVIYVYLYYALRMQKISDRLGRLLRAAFFSPAYAVAEVASRTLFNKMFYNNYRGMEHERLVLMGREVAEEALLTHLYGDARKRVDKAREMGLVQVIVSGSLDMIMEPFAEILGIDRVLANKLEFENGRATGRLIPPVLASKNKKTVIEAFAREENIDLTRSYAFGDSRYDLPMLECVGFPCAVNPDKELEQIARERGWPVVPFA